MPLFNWTDATPSELHSLTIDFLKTELDRRGLETTGLKDEIVQRLHEAILSERTQRADTTETSSLPIGPSQAPSDTTALLATCIQQNAQLIQILQASRPQQPLQVATLPDLSASVPTFEDCKHTSPKRWIEEMEKTQQLAAWQDSTVRAIAISKLRGTAKDWHFSTGQNFDTWAQWKAAFLKQFDDTLTIVEWQTRVADRNQGPQETLHQYSFSKLRLLARSPITLSDKHKIDYLLQGVNNPMLVASICAQRPKTIDDFIEIVTELDNALAHVKPRSGHTATPRTTTGTVSTASAPSQQVTPRPEGQQQVESDARRRITALPATQQESRYAAISEKYGAPAFRRGQDINEAVCYKCKQKGHLAAHCRQQQATAQVDTNSPAPTLPACHTHMLEGSQVLCPMVPTNIAGYGSIHAFPDSGSKLTIISDIIADNRPVTPWNGPPLSVVGGGHVTPEGTTPITVTIAGISGTVEAAILHRNILPFILGEDWFLAAQAELHVKPPHPSEIRHPPSGTAILCEEKLVPKMLNAVVLQLPALGIFTESPSQDKGLRSERIFPAEKTEWAKLNCSVHGPAESNESATEDSLPLSEVKLGPQLAPDEQDKLKAVLNKHTNAFAKNDDDLGCYTGARHEIQLVAGHQPYSRQPYRYSQDDRRYLEVETTRLLASGIIKRSTSAWAFPAVVVTRNKKRRLCVNYIPLNRLTIPVAQPLPRAEDLMEDVSGCTLFGTLDLKSAYWQIPLKVEDQHKTSFITHTGTYQWTRMPFGLRNAPATFQKVMYEIFEDLPARHRKCGVRVYLDDILLFAQNFQEFLQLLQDVLTLVEKSGLKISTTKCCLAVRAIKFLGYIISGTGKSPDPAKVEVLVKMPAPSTAKAVLSWIQTAGFYRKFIQGFAKIVAPLQLIVKSGQYIWTDECEQAFQTIQKCLTNAPILGHFDPQASTTVATDASGVALGAVLSQQQKGKEVVLEYASRSLTSHEKNLHSNVLECLAVHWAVSVKFRPYLLTIKFCILTDNWTVACLTSTMKPSRRFTGMLMDLTEFDFTVQHRPGRLNNVADMLSRLSYTALSSSALSKAQQGDPEIERIISDVKSTAKSDDAFTLIDSTLYRKTGSGLIVIVLPRSMRQSALELSHDGNGHMDYDRTLAKVQNRYWWPQMKKTVKDYVSACETCQINNRPITKSVGHMGEMPMSSIPFSIIAMDHITMSEDNKARYILNVIDFTTRYIVPAAVPNTSTKAVLSHLHNVFYHYGTPDHCLTDNAKCFGATEFTNFMRHHGISSHHSIPYRAASNGMIERSNATLITVLRKICQNHPDRWEKYLQEAAFAVNTSTNASLGFSPFQLLHGYTPKLPQQKIRQKDQRTLEDRLLQLCEDRREAQTTSETAREVRKRRYNREHRHKEIPMGEIVWIQRQEPVKDKCSKMAPRFKGLYTVLEKKTPYTYKVVRINPSSPRNKSEQRIVHISQIKPYKPPYQDPFLFHHTNQPHGSDDGRKSLAPP